MVVVFKGKGKALQDGKGALGLLEELVELDTHPSKGDLAYAIVMFKCSQHAPTGTSNVSNPVT